MLPRADIISVNPVGRADAVIRLEGVGDARQQAFQRSLAGLVGKSMQGEVLSRLTDGSFIVRVAGASARMLLPQGARVGSDLPLTLLSLDPRPTFQVSNAATGQVALAYAEAGPALPPAGARAAAPAGAAPGAAPDGLPAPAHPAAASAQAAPGQPAPLLARAPDAGLAAALQASMQAGQAAPAKAGQADPARAPETARASSHAATLLGKAPLMAAEQLPPLGPNSSPSLLSDTARVLANVLGSALKDNTPAAIVARTPLLAAPSAAPEQIAAALKNALASSGLFYESHVAAWSDGKLALAELAREPQMQRAAQETAPRPPGAAPDPASAQMINQQLSTQEQARVAWQGQAWPGQPMQWEVQRDTPDGRGQDGGEAPQPAWRSGVRFRFALLGQVEASVVLVGDQLHIQVRTDSEAAGALLRGQAGSLEAALEAAGSPLSSLDIRADPAAGAGHG